MQRLHSAGFGFILRHLLHFVQLQKSLDFSGEVGNFALQQIFVSLQEKQALVDFIEQGVFELSCLSKHSLEVVKLGLLELNSCLRICILRSTRGFKHLLRRCSLQISVHLHFEKIVF